jgi:hypothetical protein
MKERGKRRERERKKRGKIEERERDRKIERNP